MSLTADKLTVAGRLTAASVALRPGEVTAILGPNGAGKSSLIACLAGLLDAERGTVALDRAALSALPPRERARAIGFLPQSAEVAWDMSVETLVGLGRLPWRQDRAEDEAAIADAIAAMDLADLKDRAVNRLSGGERARALLARVLAGQPRWLLADEPLANLDLRHQQALLARFRALADRGLGVVLVLHDLAQAMNHADRVIVMAQGAVAADGAPGEVLTPALIEQVWETQARWLGEPGQRALIVT
ncbi:iron complex transport system ATP-binding protein [Novosphingobium kunmingense]|uniref:Iron complex transport system ATP-binding protein n=1 Tax=Novosphingobium kunmingense TaxID=1211806 RepID=A0A2N0I0W4_9SPHN|nr:ABC transporter ATP-binding protein [Novosphingobium kunmingense]PKB24835.1 iron complex transport system ATP-binding protein [Novosphingobium kunmingense]